MWEDIDVILYNIIKWTSVTGVVFGNGVTGWYDPPGVPPEGPPGVLPGGPQGGPLLALAWLRFIVNYKNGNILSSSI